jgi:hypothetical protein
MEREPIAFRIDNHGAKSVRPDWLSILQNFGAVVARGCDRFVEAPFDRKINERPILRRLIFVAYTVAAEAKATGRILFFVREKAVFEFAFRHFPYFLAEHCGIKLDRPIQIGHRNVGPAKCISTHCRFYILLLFLFVFLLLLDPEDVDLRPRADVLPRRISKS